MRPDIGQVIYRQLCRTASCDADWGVAARLAGVAGAVASELRPCPVDLARVRAGSWILWETTGKSLCVLCAVLCMPGSPT